MTLYIIGIGLNDANDITLKGLDAVKSCSHIYLESYTSILQCPISDLEKLYNKKIILADRKCVEQEAEKILNHAKEDNTAFLVIGDPFSATTHLDLLLRAKKQDIPTKVINNASVLTSIGITGLQLYKFGKTTSIAFFKEGWNTPYNVVAQNKSSDLHTLCLLDLDPKEDKFMTVKDALKILLDKESEHNKKVISEDSLVIGCARLGGESTIKVGKVKDLLQEDFGKPPHCLIIPGKLHFMEEEAINRFLINKQ